MKKNKEIDSIKSDVDTMQIFERIFRLFRKIKDKDSR